MLKKAFALILIFRSLAFAGYAVKTVDLSSSSGLSCNAGGPILVRCDTMRNRVLVANTLSSSFTIIDGRTHLVRNIPLAGRALQHLKAEAMTLDEKRGVVYLIGTRCFFIIDIDQERSGCVATNRQFESIAVEPNSGNVFLAGKESSALAFYQSRSKKLSYLPWLQNEESMTNANATPPPPLRKVVSDPDLRIIAALDGFTSTLYLFDSQTGRQLSHRLLNLQPSGRWHLAGYNERKHCLYLVIETTDRRVVQTARIGIQDGVDDIVKMPEFREGVGVTYNPNRDEVYVPYDNHACVHVVDFVHPVQEIALPVFGNDATAVDLRRQLLYIASWPQGDIEVVCLKTRRFLRRMAHKGILPHMFNMAFNPHDGLLYIPKGATAVNGAFGAAITTLNPEDESLGKIYTGWLPVDLLEWKKGQSFLVFNNEDEALVIDDQRILSRQRLPVEYPIQAIQATDGSSLLSYGAHQSYWPNVYIWDARNGVLAIDSNFTFYDRRLPRQALKSVVDKNGVLHFTQNPWGAEEQFLGNLPDAVRLFEAGTRLPLTDKVERETTQRLLKYDAAMNRLYLVRVAEQDSGAGILQIIDPELKKVLARVPVGRCPADLAFNDANIFVANFSAHTVSVIEKTGFKVQTLASGQQPLKIAVLRQTAWVINHQDNSIQEIRPGSNAIAIPAPGKPDQIAVWHDRLIITVHDADALTVLAFTPQSGAFETILKSNYPYGETSFATTNNSFYMTGQFGDAVFSLNQAKEDAIGRLWLTDLLSGTVFVVQEVF